MAVVQFNYPTVIRFGAGAIREVPSLLTGRKLARPLIVTDAMVARLGFLTSLASDLKRAGLAVEIFSDFSGNPIESHVKAGVAAFKQHRADSLIVIGGGAALDVGKVIALMAHHPGDLFDYEDGKPDARPVDREIPFMITIPTTSGTGSEVGRSSVISDDVTKEKKIIFSPRLLAPVVVADPELTLDLPPNVTAATGMDALTHLVEAFLVDGFHPMADGIALEGVRLVAKNLERAVGEPRSLEARSGMLAASMMGAVAFQKGLGVTHSCAHALSTVHDLHHGLANALMIVPCMKFNLSVSRERLGRLAFAAGAAKSDGGAEAERFIDWLSKTIAAIGLPTHLKAVGVATISDRLVDVATRDGCHASNPRPVTRGDLAELFAASL